MRRSSKTHHRDSIASFAQNLLWEATPRDYRTAVDHDTLGSYITHQLLEAQQQQQQQHDEDEAIIELIQEQCHVEWEIARDIVRKIVIHIQTTDEETPVDVVASPVAANNWLPNDLWDETTTTTIINPPDDTQFPPLGATIPQPHKSSHHKQKPTKQPKPTPTHTDRSIVEYEVAAALFPPTARSRQSSIDESSRRSDDTNAVPHASSQTLTYYDYDYPHQQQHYHYPPPPYQDQHQPHPSQIPPDYIYSTATCLLSMHTELSQDAAYMASSLTNADVNLAQHLIEMTISEPPVCRDDPECYRSDCPFRHGASETHTCVFWLKGNCTKGIHCRFLHGFSDRHVQSVIPQDWNQHHPNHPNTTMPLPLHPAARTANPTTTPTSSFATIAQHNYSPHIPFHDPSPKTTIRQPPKKSKPRNILIPPEVWNVHENRDASAFTIDDPLERYHYIQRYNPVPYVMDLHFQSLRTFGIVLDTLLPELLQNYDKIWIVTGTGHHVGTRTHQKSGGALEQAVMEYLEENEYSYRRGKDQTGQGGALLVEKHRK